MGGDQCNDDDPDFLDDVFVVEGLADNVPQDDLDQLFALPPEAAPAASAPALVDEAAEAALFADHGAEVAPSVTFGADQPQFAEDAPSSWNGNELELDDPSTTPASLTPPVDADDAPAEFTLDEGATWNGEAEPQSDEGDAVEVSELAPDDFLGLTAAQPLAESEELASEPATDEVEGFAAPIATVEADDVIAPVLANPAQGMRWGVMLASAAATLTIVAAAAVAALRPQWVGIPDQKTRRIAVAKVDRPHVKVELQPPAAVAVVVPQVAPVAVEPATQPPSPATVATTTPEPTPAVDEPVVAPATPVPLATAPSATTKPEPTPVADVSAAAPMVAWPVARGNAGARPPNARKPLGTLIRVGDDTMLGEADVSAGERRVVDGVIPGVKAFAQLHNGNFFIGSVKSVDAAQVTLRTSEGEVTLERAELKRLTGLGSADYAALQKATDGFVRLTNSNKLVGGILSQIADDHVVLEFRSNRVILPRSVVGEVVAGSQGEGVRLGTTTEENDWVRKLAEREVGAKSAERKSPKADGK